MKKLNVRRMTNAELTQLKADVDAELASRESKMAAIEEVKKLALTKGISVDDLIAELAGGSGKRSKPRGSVPPKYRHPKKPELTWTGRGKKPLWFQEAIDSGMAESKLLIK